MTADPLYRDVLRLVIVGHVDHGKSTLIGRLLHDTDSLPAGKLEELKAMSDRRGMALEWSFVMDAFQAERDQAITIDTAQIWFKTDARDFVIIDAPGHQEFLKNMITGASSADAAVLVVDAVEGVRQQTRRHAYLLRMLGLSQVLVVVNKMDMLPADQAEARFNVVADEIRTYLKGLDVEPVAVMPISARHGDQIATPSERFGWYDGQTVLGALGDLRPRAPAANRPLRFAVQDVYHFDDRRTVVGQIESGILRVGDTILVSPNDRIAKVKSIEAWNTPTQPVEARAGESIGFTTDEAIFVERGDVISHAEKAPMLTTVFRATVFWLSSHPLVEGQAVKVRHMTGQTEARIETIEKIIDTETLASSSSDHIERNGVAEVVIRCRQQLALDDHTQGDRSGQIALVIGQDIVGGGLIMTEGYPDQRVAARRRSANIYQVDHILNLDARALRNGHRGGVVWLTGLSGAGKSTIAMRAEQALFAKGYQTYVLDGDNVRAGLCGDLGFSPADRAENIRRVGEVAALFADAGVIVLTAFISPYRDDRDRARKCRPDAFHEIHVKADVEACSKRDPKGLYKRAIAGEIKEFTGVSAPYEAPEDPELVIDTETMSVEDSVRALVEYIETTIGHAADRAA